MRKVTRATRATRVTRVTRVTQAARAAGAEPPKPSPSTALVPVAVPAPPRQAAIDLVLEGLVSDQSKRAYKAALGQFLAWVDSYYRPGGPGSSGGAAGAAGATQGAQGAQGAPQGARAQGAASPARFTKSLAAKFRDHLAKDLGLAPATVNQRMSAVRALATELADARLMDPHDAAAVTRVRGVRSSGQRTGNWLQAREAERLIDSPDPKTAKGIRDRAMLGLLIGCGLRRAEIAGLTWGQLRQLDGRWVIADLMGKGNKLRTVPMPGWSKAFLDLWRGVVGAVAETGPGQGAGQDDGQDATQLVFHPVNKAGRVHVTASGLTSHAVYLAVKDYAAGLGLAVGPHDLRRTFARLAYRGRADLKQIQLSLGHASVATTERYIGMVQDIGDAPCDHLGIKPAPASPVSTARRPS